MNDEYYKKIKKMLIDNYGVDEDEIVEDAYFGDDLNLGDLELEEMLQVLEDEYEITFEEEERGEIETVDDLTTLLSEKLD
ncbi:MAG: acyl carrier protein [Patescibacteria group bacterium]